MSKAILVLNEMPRTCGNCPFLEIYYSEENDCDYQKCFAKNRMYITDTDTIHEKCPLKPMLSREDIYEKMYLAYGLWKEEYYERMRNTVDKVLDEIFGEVNEKIQ